MTSTLVLAAVVAPTMAGRFAVTGSILVFGHGIG